MNFTDRILVIEDDDMFRKTLVKTLERENYYAEGVDDGLRAVNIVDDRMFDIIISDVRLGGEIDGIEAIRRIKENHPEVKFRVIIMTGYSGEDAPVRAIKIGVDDFIHKPFKMEEFLLSIKKNSKILHYDKEKKEDLFQLKELREKVEIYNNNLEKRFNEETNKLNLLFKASKGFTSSIRLDEVLDLVVDKIVNVLKLDRCSLLLFDDAKNELSIVAHKGFPEDVVKRSKIKLGEMISGWVLQNKEPILVNDIETDPRFLKINEENIIQDLLLVCR